MKDQIADGVMAVARFLLGYLLWDCVLFNLGRGSLLLCTLGRYPRGPALRRDNNRIAIAGMLVLILAWSCIALYNHFAPNHGRYSG